MGVLFVTDQLECRYCFHSSEPDLDWQVFSNGTVHLRAFCVSCGAYIKYVPQTDEWLAAVGPRPEPPVQLL